MGTSSYLAVLALQPLLVVFVGPPLWSAPTLWHRGTSAASVCSAPPCHSHFLRIDNFTYCAAYGLIDPEETRRSELRPPKLAHYNRFRIYLFSYRLDCRRGPVPVLNGKRKNNVAAFPRERGARRLPAGGINLVVI